MKEVILTGIRANNDLHIGNYFGALLPMVDMAREKSGQYEINLFVPDLHSFTTPIDHDSLQKNIMHNLKLFVAAGLPLDNDSIHIYRQSYIPAHSELTWILDCFTGFGEMSKMTQFKDKTDRIDFRREISNSLIHYEQMKQKFGDRYGEKEFVQYIQMTFGALQHLTEMQEKEVTVGLYNYPVLMAADILLYGAKYIPVGDDQTQHLEFTRDIAERMNKQFGDLFVVPEPVAKQHEFFGKDQGLRIKDLTDPTKKMSKSTESDKGVIFLGDDPEAACRKVKTATTDSEKVVGKNPDPLSRPGIFNLVQIYKLLKPDDSYDFSQESYGEFKDRVGTAVMDFLENFQERLAAVDEQLIKQKLETSETKMSETAGKTLLNVQKAVGLRPNQ